MGKSQSRAYELLDAAKVDENLKFSGIPEKQIPSKISQLTELGKLPLNRQAEGLLKADEIAQTQGKKRSAVHVAQAVKLVEQQSQPAPADSTPGTVQQELEQKAKELGLPVTSGQVLPDIDRNHISPADVDDRPFASVALRNTNVNVTIEPLSNVSHLQDDQLKQLIKDAKQVIRVAKLELNKRHHPMKRSGTLEP